MFSSSARCDKVGSVAAQEPDYEQGFVSAVPGRDFRVEMAGDEIMLQGVSSPSIDSASFDMVRSGDARFCTERGPAGKWSTACGVDRLQPGLVR